MSWGLRRGVRTGVRGVGDVVFPKSCLVSDEPLGEGEVHFCGRVREEMARLAVVNYCRRCGTTVGPYERHGRERPCGRCAERDLGVHTLVRVGPFEQPLKRVVYRLKFAGEWELAGPIAPLMAQAMRGAMEGSGVEIDGIVPLPLHWKRQMDRGFNQAEELAHAVGKLLGVPVWRSLRRVRATEEQAGLLSKTQRRENVHGAFAARRDARLAGKHVWLLDDVCTTGSTLHAAATAIRKLGSAAVGIRPASINGLVLCVTETKAPVRVVELDSDEVEGEDGMVEE